MEQRNFDLVIAGAGPAGSLAAYTAAREGLAVLLLERESFPRPKACGGLMSGKTMAALPWPLPEEVLECPIRGVSLANTRGEALLYRQEEAFAVTVRREHLDQFLLEKARGAGARFLDNTPLTDLSQREEDLTVVTPQGNFRALVVIGADGYQSRTARAAGLRRQWSPWERGTALVSRPFLPREEAARLTRGGDAATFFTLPLPASLGWLFPLDTGVSVGIGAPSLVGKQLFPLFQDFLALLNRTYGTSIPCRQPQIWHLPAGGFPRPLARGNVLLVGDAAGFVDPLLRGGHLLGRQQRYYRRQPGNCLPGGKAAGFPGPGLQPGMPEKMAAGIWPLPPAGPAYRKEGPLLSYSKAQSQGHGPFPHHNGGTQLLPPALSGYPPPPTPPPGPDPFPLK